MKRVATLLSLALLLSASACGGPKTKLELGMRDVNITAPRLLTPAIELVPAAPLPTSLPTFDDIPLPAIPKRPPEPATCKEADAFAAPDQTASVIIASPPAPGAYVQQSTGSYTDAAGKTTKLDGPVVTTVTPATHTTASNGQKVDAWYVTHTDTAHKAAWVEAYQLVHPLGGLAGGTNPGVWLVGLAWDDPRGKLVFLPTGNGVQLLPTPIVQAQNNTQYAGAATDPATLNTLSIVRNVRQRTRIDACGTLLDTYTVDVLGILTTRNDARQLDWKQHWATAFGAADVDHTFKLTNPLDGSTYTRTLRNTTAPKAVTP